MRRLQELAPWLEFRYKDIVRLIRDIYAGSKAGGRPVISMEFFPPKTEEGERRFFDQTVPALSLLKPDFCSVTYGAGGGTRHKTISIVERIQRQHQVPAVAHLTCVGSTREHIRGVLDEARAAGIRNILALRGDPPLGTEFTKVDGGFEYAAELVRFIREIGGFGIGVAGFPEGHPACGEGRQADWRYLKAKIEAGADFVITQLFFNNQDYFQFRDYLTSLGITIPVVPGILPILSASQIRKFAALCGASLPAALQCELDKRAQDDAAAAEYGIEYATRQCQELLGAGVPGLHFYTLNRARAMTRILQNLGVV